MKLRPAATSEPNPPQRGSATVGRGDHVRSRSAYRLALWAISSGHQPGFSGPAPMSTWEESPAPGLTNPGLIIRRGLPCGWLSSKRRLGGDVPRGPSCFIAGGDLVRHACEPLRPALQARLLPRRVGNVCERELEEFASTKRKESPSNRSYWELACMPT